MSHYKHDQTWSEYYILGPANPDLCNPIAPEGQKLY